MPDVRLGLRLARGSTSGDRLRGVSTLLASLAGSWLMLATLSGIRAEIHQPSYDGNGIPLLVLTVVATIGVPVLVLVATTSRLSAVLRDRRLAGLRLLGLSHRRTRVVAAVEAGAGAVVGSVLGLIVFLVTRPALAKVQLAGRDWSTSAFAPWPASAVLVVIGLPLAAVFVSLVPGSHPAASDRQATSVPIMQRRGWWRFAPLLLGLVATLASTSGVADSISGGRFGVLVAGGIMCAIGLVLVVPVFTALIAELMVRVPGGPALRIAGRRLQSQPAGVSRVVAGLLIGLFIVSGGRMVVGAFESTPQYVEAARAATSGPASYEVTSETGDGADATAEGIRSLDGVVAAFVQRQVVSGCDDQGPCLTGFVGTCDDLLSAVPDAVGCSDDRVAWLDEAAYTPAELGLVTRWQSQSDPPGRTADVPTPARDDVITSKRESDGATGALQAEVFIPSSIPGLTALADEARGDMMTSTSVLVDPRQLSETQLRAAVRAIDPAIDAYATFDDAEYDFVAGLRALVWGVAAIVLAVGLLGFAIATIDRSVSRRAEMVSLQLVGTPRRMIRAAQWWEAAVPLLVGIVLAIATGALVGSAYLAYGGDSGHATPWGSVLTLGAVSLAAAIGIAGLTVVACAPRIRAELIRRA